MHSIKRSVLLPYSADRMFALVADVEQYPRFMPWCARAEVLEQDTDGVLARLQIRFAGIDQSFTTRNDYDRPRRIALSLRDGPFSTLAGAWDFTALAEQACRVELTLHYSFSSMLVERVIGAAFNQIAANLVDAFVKRAEQRYG